jgi:hypothetical protein
MERSTHNFLPEDEEVEEVDSLCFVETLRDPLQRAMRIKLMINKTKN